VVAVLDLPAEERTQDKGLGRLQQERAAVELTFAQLQDGFEVAEDVVGGGEVPDQAARGAVGDVVEVSTAGIADVRTGDDVARQDSVRIGGRAVSR